MRRPKVTARQVADARALRGRGLTYGQIAIRLGLPDGQRAWELVNDERRREIARNGYRRRRARQLQEATQS